MYKLFNWKKGFFSTLCNVYSGDVLFAHIKDKPFSKSAEVEIRGKGYSFRNRGFFKQHTEIIEKDSGKSIGEITYAFMKSRAELTFSGKTAEWKFDNFWRNKWSISSPGGILIKYEGSMSKGKIESHVESELLIMSGLFVANYYRQMMMAVTV